MHYSNEEMPLEQSPAEHSFRQALSFLQIVWRRKFIVIAAMLFGGVLGGLKVARDGMQPPKYHNSGSLMLHQLGSDSDSSHWASSRAPVDNYKEILLSSTVMESAINKLSTRPPELLSNLPKEEWPGKLRTMLSVNSESRSSSIVHVNCVSTSETAPAEVINEVIQASQEFLDATQANMSLEIVQSLDRERLDLEAKLFEKERTMYSARRQIGAVNVGEDGENLHPLVQRTLELNKSYLGAQRRRVELQASLAAIARTVSLNGDLTPHLEPLTELLGADRLEATRGEIDAEVTTAVRQQITDGQNELAALQKFYGPRHPKIVKLTESLRQGLTYLSYAQNQRASQWQGLRNPVMGQQILALVREGVAVETERENALRVIFEDAEKDAIELNGKLAEVQILGREVDLLREMHTMLLGRLAGTNVNEDGARMRLFVMDRPKSLGELVPQTSTTRTAALFLIAGMAFGIGIVYVIDTLDDRFRSPEELKQQLGIELLGVINNLPEQQGVGIDGLCVAVTPNAVESEAFRSLRTTFVFSGEPRERLAITSAEPHDGKTTVLSNLAVTYATAGKRTLMIDADLRSPGLTRHFNMRGLNGLSRILKSTDPIAEIAAESIRETGMEGLHVIPCGPKPPNPSELLSGPRLSELIAWAESEYDQILIDCPPILAASDASIVGRLVDGLALVVQPPKNRRKLVIRATEMLKSAGVEIVGVIANRIGGQKDGYGYGYGYGYGHSYGYGHDDHDEDHQRVAPSEPDSVPHDEEKRRDSSRRAA